MVRITSAITFLLTAALGVQAAATCQCLFQDGSNCCVYSDTRGGAESCDNVCRGARRVTDNAACNANGKWSSVSAWNAQWRTGCAR
ncbi:hypothetical protein NW768_002314 [Fusarium equiseti]|uniref:Uncharacterized protein n=1 Tax=Fusarium equiseti TaxID=61235 RepID=A0ABQ8RNB8_FUSEQ|nr:hypothetical protein NW768_002314 [Fusarium equiseti]